MTWTVLFSPDFMHWYQQQPPELQDKVIAELAKLEQYGPLLGRPWADQVKGSAYINMKELRFLFSGAPYRFFMPLTRCAGLSCCAQAINLIKNGFTKPISVLLTRRFPAIFIH